MMRKQVNWLLFTAASVLCVIAGCPVDNPSSSGGSGTLKLLITDMPFPFDFIASATVTISEVRVHRAGDDASDDEAGDDDAGGNENANSAADDDSDAGDANANANASADSGQDAPDLESNDDKPADSAGEDSADDSSSDEADDAGSDEGGSADAAGDEDSDDGKDGGSAWVTVFAGEKSFNLLDLRNGRTDLLADAEIPAGSYDQMRLIVSAGEVTLTDGRVFPLKVPSGEQSGIKLHISFDVAAEGQTQLLLDVDLSRAFQAIPSGHIDDVSTIRSFKFSPSIAMRLVNLLEAGSISGMVSDGDGNPLEGAAVTAYRPADGSEEEVSTSVSEVDGSFQLIGLPSGTYRLEFSKDGFEDAELLDVEVQAGAATENVNMVMSPTLQ